MNLPVSPRNFARRLLSWYRKHRRPLPWRQSSDPYRIWLSEIMLQQTQVRTVIPYYRRFLERYPSLEELAGSDENEVLSLWSGLGYYRRARDLRRAAIQMCERHGGKFPRDFRQAGALPGVGRYTAGAVLSIAYGEAVPVLDGNVRRLFARYLKIEDDLHGPAGGALWETLSSLARDPAVSPHIGDFNQALMELGSRVCLPRNPDCGNCPLAGSCLGFRAGLQTELPRTRRRRPVEEHQYMVAVIRRGSSLLLVQNQKGSFLRGLWEFPRLEGRPGNGVERAFLVGHGLEIEVQSVLSPLSHRITFRKLIFYPLLASLRKQPPENGFVWAKPGRKEYPISSYVRKICDRLGRRRSCTG